MTYYSMCTACNFQCSHELPFANTFAGDDNLCPDCEIVGSMVEAELDPDDGQTPMDQRMLRAKAMP